MRLAVITDEISQDFEHALDVMLEYGVTGAELRGLWGTNIADLSEEQTARALDALHARGMSVVCLATPFYKCDLAAQTPNEGEAVGRMHLATPRTLEQQMDSLRRCAALAHRFETPYLRVFSFWRKEPMTAELEARIVEAFAEPLALAEREGLVLLLENEHSCYIGTGAEAARIASALSSPHFGLVWDPGNALVAGENPFPEGYEAVKPWMKHFHIKDAVYRPDPARGENYRWCVVGEGVIDYVGQFAALRRDGYDGYLSLETHYRPETGSGEGGRGTPEEGSRPCLASLTRLLAG